MTDKEILQIEDRLVSKVDALQALLRTEKQKAALSSLWENIVEWRDAFLELLGEQVEEEAEKKEASAEETLRFLHRQLSGMAVQFSSFASRRPEEPCGAFKAQQVNAVLRPLQALREEDTLAAGASLTLVSETGEHTCSDVLFLLQNWLDVCADFAVRHYDGVPPSNPPVTRTYHPKIIRLLILDFCMDEPKTLREIGKMLGYRDKKTVHKYVDPLLRSGCL